MTAPPARGDNTAAGRWQTLVTDRLEEMERITPGGSAVGAAFWDRRARRFSARLPVEMAARDPFLARLLRVCHPATTVLDVGAGTGRFTLNLAPKVRSVTAVDPSARMLTILRQGARQRGIANVRTVTGPWEEVDVPAADVVFSSYVLPVIGDAAGFLAKLHAAARRRAYLYLGAFSTDAVVDPLWRHFHGAPRRPGPSYIDAVAVLRELGIAPAVEVVEILNRAKFASVADATEEYRDHLLLPDTRRAKRELESVLALWLVKRGGAFRPPLRYVPAAIISWRAGGPP